MLEQTPPWAKLQPPQQDSQFHHYLFVKGNTQQNEIFEESWAHSGLWQQLNFQIQWTQPTFHDDIAKDKHHCVIQLPAVSFWRTLSGWQRKAESKGKKKIRLWSMALFGAGLLACGAVPAVVCGSLPNKWSHPAAPQAHQQGLASLLSVEHLPDVYPCKD